MKTKSSLNRNDSSVALFSLESEHSGSQTENKSKEQEITDMKKSLGTMIAIIAGAILIGTFITANYATAGERARDGRFIAYDNGTVLDTKTNLMWAAYDNGGNINWYNAKSYCENYRGGGYTDWRLPTEDELVGLYDRSINAVNHLTALITLSAPCPWASETRGSEAANFCFDDGTRGWDPQSDAVYGRVLAVRSAK